MCFRSFLLLALMAFTLKAKAYPEFIGYGYASCLACHHNAAGGGGLSDYGRGLWAAEIAAKPFWLKDASDEKQSEWSNFLGKKTSPYWLKPGIKFRRLFNQINPGSVRESDRYYTMQADLNVASYTSEDQTLGFIGTLAYVENPVFAAPNQTIGNSELMPREYYVKWQVREPLWIYFGFLDKTYGLRTPDHTAVSRAPIGVGQNDQVHGAVLHYLKEDSDLFINPYAGNLALAGRDQLRGAAILYEWQPADKVRYGLSTKYEADADSKFFNAGIHARKGLAHGHALLFEFGLKDRTVDGAGFKRGLYQFLELHYRIVRGLNFQSILQLDKSEFRESSPENLKWGLGLLYFPIQRVEWRFQAVEQRSRSKNSVQDDQWIAQIQLHLSL